MAFFRVKCACLVVFLVFSLTAGQDTLGKQRSESMGESRSGILNNLHPTADFNRHSLVKPKIYHGREKREISNTKEESGNHLDHIQITLEVDKEKMTLDLALNKNLIPKGFFQRHQENGNDVIHKPSIQEIDHCHYHGKVRGKRNSWAAISTCNDALSGAIFDGTEMHYIEKDSSSPDTHFWYKHSDMAEHNKSCGFDGEAHDGHVHKHNMTDNRFLRYKRSVDDSPVTIRGPYNSNKDSKYVELVLVVDNREYKELGESRKRVIDHCKNIANIINGLYNSLNIFIALVGVVIWTENDEIIFTSNGDTTLTNFLHFRKDKLIFQHPNDNAQLLTKFSFDQGVVGKALKGPMCTYEYSGGVNTDHSPVVGLVATTIAHEMGHNFGMEHDTVDCQCPDERCIMAPSSSTVAPTHWSSCSLNYLLLAFTHGMDYCLKNKPESLFDSPVCGNGFVEPGEECDCGLHEYCENPCCDPRTCMLHVNASCATGECCDLTTCKPKTAGTLCRSADYECDLPEYCTGQSEFCPPDIYKLDAETCDDGKSFCYQGFCRTRTDQCKLLWGETGKSSDDQCYDMNVKGNRHGNCGYNKIKKSYAKCDNESILCGMLHCKHLNERLEFGMESVAVLSHSFINKKGSIIPCRTAIVDLGTNQIDPGMTPDGAKCGEGKMCVNQHCMDVMSLRRSNPSCEKDCNGNGWCNSKGHCHCKDGFAPPYCDYPGPGGSEDSGPASDPNAHRGVVIALFVIFLGIVPSIALIGLLLYYAKYNVKLTWMKTSAPTQKSPSKSRGPPFPTETTKRTEANHSLLCEDSPPPQGLNNAFFGNFKGFSLTPFKNEEPEPVIPAPDPPGWTISNEVENPGYQKPPPPVPKGTLSDILSKPVQKINSFRKTYVQAPQLPPPNPGSTARPIISSPVLESSTSNAKELPSPLRQAPKVPIRPAPEAPSEVSKPDKQASNIITDTSSSAGTNTGRPSTINRIASFLKPQEKKPQSNTLKAPKKIDKETLRTLKISDPMPQASIDLPPTVLPVEEASKKAVVMRAQSMRATKSPERPKIQTFGSMRKATRPLSIPSATRPKNPPPPAPPASRSNEYDDCLNKAEPLKRLSEENSPTSGDNIYAVIDESPSKKEEPANLGLLGEIVSEIQQRNFDSIYSTSTLGRKKKEQEEAKRKQKQQEENSEYVNAASIYSNEYRDMGKSSASSTSSGYILPSAVNKPEAKQASKPPLSSFKSKPSEPEPSKKAESKPTVSASPSKAASKATTPAKVGVVTPPKSVNNLRTRKASPTRPRSVSNSPDLVASCNTATGSKNPDVVTPASKKPTVTAKPSIAAKKPISKAVSLKNSQDKKEDKAATTVVGGKTAFIGLKAASRSNSTVASLQQKFEEKNNVKTAPKVKS